MKKKIMTLGSGLLALVLVLAACSSDQEAQAPANSSQGQAQVEEEFDRTSPDFSLTTMEGETMSLADFEGKKVLIQFWGSWCPICMSGLEDFDALSAAEKDYEVYSVVAPGLMGEMERGDFIAWFKDLGHENMRVLFDDDGSFIETFGIRAAPTNVFLGSDSALVDVIPGQIDEAMLDKIFLVID